MLEVTPNQFFQLCSIYFNRSSSVSSTSDRRFMAMYGASPLVCTKIWDHLRNNLHQLARPVYLLLSISFLKFYTTENVFQAIFNVDEKTFRKWTKYFIQRISVINNVSSSFLYKIESYHKLN